MISSSLLLLPPCRCHINSQNEIKQKTRQCTRMRFGACDGEAAPRSPPHFFLLPWLPAALPRLPVLSRTMSQFSLAAMVTHTCGRAKDTACAA